MNIFDSIFALVIGMAFICVGCTSVQTSERNGLLNESQSNSQEIALTSQKTIPSRSIAEAGPETVVTTLPVIDGSRSQNPSVFYAESEPTTAPVRHAETKGDLEEGDSLDSENLSEIEYVTKLPSAGFRGVLYAHTNYPNSDPSIDFQFLDAKTNLVTKTKVIGSHAIDCWTFFVSDNSDWNLPYENFDSSSDASQYSRVAGVWGEVAINRPVSHEDYLAFLRLYNQSSKQFSSGELSFVLTHYDNGFSLDVNGILRQYHVRPWNYLNDPLGGEEPSASEHGANTGLVREPSGTPRTWGASLLGTDGELFAIAIQSTEPACGKRFVYIISMVTGEIVHCTWTNAKFLLVAPSDRATTVDEILLPPSGWFNNEPCENDESDLVDLAAVLEIRGRLDG